MDMKGDTSSLDYESYTPICPPKGTLWEVLAGFSPAELGNFVSHDIQSPAGIPMFKGLGFRV